MVIGRKNLSKYNILQENDHAQSAGQLLIMHKITNIMYLAETKFPYFLNNYHG